MSPGASLVYVLDDDRAVRAALSLLLETCGWQCVECSNAEEFFAYYVPRRKQCLILDLNMPGRSGLEVQAALLARGDPLPVIVVTAHHDQPSAHQARAKGALAVLGKPFDDQELIGWVANALADVWGPAESSC